MTTLLKDMPKGMYRVLRCDVVSNAEFPVGDFGTIDEAIAVTDGYNGTRKNPQQDAYRAFDDEHHLIRDEND